MRSSRRRREPQPPLEPIASYHAIFFHDVAQAVQWCDRLVPAVVESQAHGACERPAVWFHAPARVDRDAARGCYLFLSPGAMPCLTTAGLTSFESAAVPRHMLPAAAVLVLGVDEPLPADQPGERPAIATPQLADLAQQYVTPPSVAALRYPGSLRSEAVV